ncbi:TPA: N-acetyltransferase [Vibrio vulnificus]|nr:N-acetyltransferase [Vibrio vulnificus]EKO5168552.1 N-acetyltransferase [Vibrio vulnificus]HAS8448487.1 N-acetyltransferase [Vibrio vulnificus]
MLIRTEAPADILVIDSLLKQVFPTDAEANLVMALRENGRLTLSLVACTDEGEVVGYVMFTPMHFNGEENGWQGLAPLAVKADYRQQGIASNLINEGLTTLLEFGYPACFVLGDPSFYQRFGFSAAKTLGFDSQWELPDGAFQAVAMAEGVFAGQHGLVKYSPEFDAV